MSHEPRQTVRSYQIYALIDPRDNLAHYVGLSVSAEMRLAAHLSGSCGNEQEKRWILELQRENLSPTLQILETIEAGNNAFAIACEAELYWIREMARSGHPLLNLSGLWRAYPIHRPRKREMEKMPTRISQEMQRTENKSVTNAPNTPKTDPTTSYNLMTVDEVAAELSVNSRKVHQFIQSGELVVSNIGTQDRKIFRIHRSDFDAFLQSRKIKRQDS